MIRYKQTRHSKATLVVHLMTDSLYMYTQFFIFQAIASRTKYLLILFIASLFLQSTNVVLELSVNVLFLSSLLS